MNKILNGFSRYTREFKYNLKLAYPVMIGMLGHTFVQFIDNVMVGQLGTAELAGYNKSIPNERIPLEVED